MVTVLAIAFAVGVTSCKRDAAKEPKAPQASSTKSDSLKVANLVKAASRDTVPLGVHGPSELVDAATQVIHFLQGEAEFDQIRVADTVTLYISPEGGGTHRTLTAKALRDRSNWKVPSPGERGSQYSFVPPKGKPELKTRVGHHLVCGAAQPLASRFKDLAELPHVGTTLIYGTTSCLQSWNLTLIFDPNRKPPTLVAAVYNQYEW